MIVDTNGRIAYHSILLDAEGGTTYVQYDFDGSVLYSFKRTPAVVYIPKPVTWLDRLLGVTD